MRYSLVVTIVSLLLTGCAGNDFVMQRQSTMESRLEQLAQSGKAASLRLAELDMDFKMMRDKLDKLADEQSSIRPAQLILQADLTRLVQKMEKIEADIPPAQATRIEVVNRETAAEVRDVRAQNAYLNAFGLFSANNYAAAAEAFAAFIKSYPESEHAGNAQYWLGECYYSDKLYAQAIETFNIVVNSSMQGPKVPDAMLKIGFSWYALNDPVKGQYVLLTLIEKFPSSEAAAKAKEKVKQK